MSEPGPRLRRISMAHPLIYFVNKSLSNRCVLCNFSGSRINTRFPPQLTDGGTIGHWHPMKRLLKKCKGLIYRVAVLAIVASILLVLPLRWIYPPLTSFMVIRQIEAWTQNQTGYQLHYKWRNWDKISPQLALAVIAGEDQKFPAHSGVDFTAIRQAVVAREKTGRLRGASTISQQLAKNLFLWGGRSLSRKVIEAYFAILLELLLEKKRILEIYVNVAEFGNGIYGAEEASKKYFDRSAQSLSKYQASLLAAVLPKPKKLDVNRPSPYLKSRSKWIRKQMYQLGGLGYLDHL